jgi:hypothetical protein
MTPGAPTYLLIGDAWPELVVKLKRSGQENRLRACIVDMINNHNASVMRRQHDTSQ